MSAVLVDNKAGILADEKEKKIDMRIIADWKAEDVDALIGTQVAGDKALPVSSFDFYQKK